MKFKICPNQVWDAKSVNLLLRMPEYLCTAYLLSLQKGAMVDDIVSFFLPKSGYIVSENGSQRESVTPWHKTLRRSHSGILAAGFLAVLSYYNGKTLSALNLREA